MIGAIFLAVLIVGTVSPGVIYAELLHRREQDSDTTNETRTR